MIIVDIWPSRNSVHGLLLANLHTDCNASNTQSRRIVNMFICPINLLFMLRHICQLIWTRAAFFSTRLYNYSNFPQFPNFPVAQRSAFLLFSHTFRIIWAAINYNIECSISTALPWQSPGHAPTHAPNVQLKCPLTGCDKNQRERETYIHVYGDIGRNAMRTIKPARSRAPTSKNRAAQMTPLTLALFYTIMMMIAFNLIRHQLNISPNGWWYLWISD